MKRGWIAVLTLLLLLPALQTNGQSTSARELHSSPAPVGPTGTVTGHVTCDDTHGPARMARVLLLPVTATPTDPDTASHVSGIGETMTQTDADGNYVIAGVSTGEYYVVASLTGYLSLGDIVRQQLAAGTAPADIMARVPTVNVAADSSASTNATVVRAGVLEGTITWQDGSPAGSLRVFAQLASKPPTFPKELARLIQLDYFAGSHLTDDRGHFRLAGMASGEYILTTNVSQYTVLAQSPSRTYSNFSDAEVYAPGVFHHSDAEHFTLHAGETRDDIRIVLDFSLLHTVSGHIDVTVPNRTFVGGGIVVSDSSDDTPNVNHGLIRFGTIDPQGNFTLKYVPAGTYQIHITPGFADQNKDNGTGSSEDFTTSPETLTVGDSDVSGLAITLTPQKPK